MHIALNYNIYFFIVIIAGIAIVKLSKNSVSSLLSILFVYTIFLAFSGIVQFIFAKFGLVGMYLWGIPIFDNTRIMSFIGQPNILAAYINIGIVLLIFSKHKFSSSFIYFLLSFMFAFVLVYTNSRAGELTFILLMTLLLFANFKSKFLDYKWIFMFVIIFAVIKIISISGVISIAEGGRSVFSESAGVSTFSRIIFWLTALTLFWKNPITGVGAGSFNTSDATIQPQIADKLNLVYESIQSTFWAHNDFLHYLSEYGIVFIIVCIVIFYKLYKKFSSDKIQHYL
ncbi:O-antigen ligase family protein, partial [Flexistipes sp.]|uniref:O-antigen ligase family protein n=1 Tax=Flexistipes sp. TaxID=3088135 RepID=UPI002E1FC938|nr:O-antigen ligase family protein [Flexistipes sp.]